MILLGDFPGQKCLGGASALFYGSAKMASCLKARDTFLCPGAIQSNHWTKTLGALAKGVCVWCLPGFGGYFDGDLR